MEKLVFNIGDEFHLKPGEGIIKTPAYQSATDLISAILPNVYVVAGVILFILLILGGLIIVIGAGQTDSEKVQKGQKAVMSAIIGFLIIFVSYWLIQIVEVITGIEIF